MTETVDAKKTRYGAKEAVKLARHMKKVTVVKGNKIVEAIPSEHSDEDLAKLLLGPSGNLRAPTARIKDQLFVGFSESFYE